MVIIRTGASIGKAAILDRPMATSQDYANWICSEELSPRYLLQVFRHMQDEWRRLSSGSAHPTVYMPDFRNLKILLPPELEEQEAIAEIGEKFHHRIQREHEFVEALIETKASIARELLSGRVRVITPQFVKGES